MAQAVDFSLSNQSGSAFRTELNSILAAIQTLNSGSTAPSNLVAHMVFLDTSTTPATLKIRNAANDGFITLGTASTNFGLVSASGATFTGDITLNAQSASFLLATETTNGQVVTGGVRGAITTLTDAATIAVDMDDNNNFKVTLGGNRTLGNPSNVVEGQTGFIEVIQDGTGSRTLSFSSNYRFVGGTAPTLTTTASAVDILAYAVMSDEKIMITAHLDVKAAS